MPEECVPGPSRCQTIKQCLPVIQLDVSGGILSEPAKVRGALALQLYLGARPPNELPRNVTP